MACQMLFIGSPHNRHVRRNKLAGTQVAYPFFLVSLFNFTDCHILYNVSGPGTARVYATVPFFRRISNGTESFQNEVKEFTRGTSNVPSKVSLMHSVYWGFKGTLYCFLPFYVCCFKICFFLANIRNIIFSGKNNRFLNKFMRAK